MRSNWYCALEVFKLRKKTVLLLRKKFYQHGAIPISKLESLKSQNLRKEFSGDGVRGAKKYFFDPSSPSSV